MRSSRVSSQESCAAPATTSGPPKDGLGRAREQIHFGVETSGGIGIVHAEYIGWSSKRTLRRARLPLAVWNIRRRVEFGAGLSQPIILSLGR